MELTGAQIMVKSLEDEGVKTVFGLPGGTVIPLYDAIYDSSLEHILVRHEQAAAHAADGFSRVGEEVGVCIATSGPGATNLVTGLATAHRDSSPMVAITGQVATGSIGTDSFQEAHMMGISLSIVKHSMQVRRAEDIPRMVQDAFFIASTGRPGPVVVDLPVDIQKAPAEYRRPSNPGGGYPGYSANPPEDLTRFEEAVKLIRHAERPLVIAGNGVNLSWAFESLRLFCEKLEMPGATSLLGKGVFSSDHPNFIGMVGMHGNAAVNRAVMAADLIIAVGTRFSDRSTGKSEDFARSARVLHIDIDNSEIGKNVNADVWLLGETGKILDLLAQEAGGHNITSRRTWMEKIRKMETEEPQERSSGDEKIHPWQILEALDKMTKGELILTTEVGQHQMWAAQYHKALYPRRFVTSGGLGTMGFGIPASMGAHFARPDLPVVCVAGDGSAMMNIQELDTYARYNLPVKVLLFDNSCLGMVRQWQQLFYGCRYSHTLYQRHPDFVKIAEGMGVEAFSVDSPEKIESAIERALEIPGPVLVHFPIPQLENVFPIVPAGESLSQMLLN
ncbi:MAG: biosynthetic-type acetolactate synthase large subunit [Synergistaceae bacterium]|nr:biosynthetic-type acetolactate synthase large subunit [Synergistaceae bacterium]